MPGLSLCPATALLHPLRHPLPQMCLQVVADPALPAQASALRLKTLCPPVNPDLLAGYSPQVVTGGIWESSGHLSPAVGVPEGHKDTSYSLTGTPAIISPPHPKVHAFCNLGFASVPVCLLVLCSFPSPGLNLSSLRRDLATWLAIEVPRFLRSDPGSYKLRCPINGHHILSP